MGRWRAWVAVQVMLAPRSASLTEVMLSVVVVVVVVVR